MKGDGEWEMAYYVCDLYGSRTPFSHLATWPPNQRPSVVTTQWQTTVLPSLSLFVSVFISFSVSLSFSNPLASPSSRFSSSPSLLPLCYILFTSTPILRVHLLLPSCSFVSLPLPSSPLFLLPLIYCNSSYFPFVFLFLILLSLLEDNPVL